MRIMPFLALLFCAFALSSHAETKKSCRDVYCSNTTLMGWAPCHSELVMKTKQFHVFKVGGEEIIVCGAETNGTPSDETVVSVPPYNFPSGTKLVDVNQEKFEIKVSSESPRELMKTIAKDLTIKTTSSVKLRFCPQTRSFQTFCLNEKQMQAARITEQSPLRAFAQRPEGLFLINAEGISVLDKSDRAIAFFKGDGGFDSTDLGQANGWVFFALTITDGDDLSSKLIGYSEEKKSFTEILSYGEAEISFSKKEAQSVTFKFAVSENGRVESPHIVLKKPFKCGKGQLSKKAKSSAVTLDLHQKKQLSILQCL